MVNSQSAPVLPNLLESPKHHHLPALLASPTNSLSKTLLLSPMSSPPKSLLGFASPKSSKSGAPSLPSKSVLSLPGISESDSPKTSPDVSPSRLQQPPAPQVATRKLATPCTGAEGIFPVPRDASSQHIQDDIRGGHPGVRNQSSNAARTKELAESGTILVNANASTKPRTPATLEASTTDMADASETTDLSTAASPPSTLVTQQQRHHHHHHRHRHQRHHDHCQHDASPKKDGAKKRAKRGHSLPQLRSQALIKAAKDAKILATKEVSSDEGSEGSCSKDEGVDELCGFRLRAKVMTEAEGPWKNMGNGRVMGPAREPGMVIVKFKGEQGHGGSFPIKASHLKVVPKGSANVGGEVAVEAEERRVLSLSEQANKYLMSHEAYLDQYGIAIGDAVIFQMNDPWDQDGGKGVVVAHGAQPWMVMVKFPAVGTRSVPIDQLTKVVFKSMLNSAVEGPIKKTKDNRALLAKIWANIDIEQPDAMGKSVAPKFRIGDYVRAKAERWKDMGIGIIRNVGEEPDSACVQYNILGERWNIRFEDLEHVPDPGSCEFGYTTRQDFDHRRRKTGDGCFQCCMKE